MTGFGKLPALNGNRTVTPQYHVLTAAFLGLPVGLSWTTSKAEVDVNMFIKKASYPKPERSEV